MKKPQTIPNNERASQLFKQALEIISVVPGAPEALRWRLAVGLGDTYRAMGKFEESMSALRTCIGLMQTGRLDALQRSELYRGMGNTARKQGEYQIAQSYFKAAILILGEPDTGEFTDRVSPCTYRICLGTIPPGFI